jgi:hypothetical protein
MNNHTDFILSPISSILKDVILANSGIGNGIETYPLHDYVMQSVFLKMTGFQEQKIRSISWEMATNDYEYRRVLLSNDDKVGEYSSYKDKNKIYQRLNEQIVNSFPLFNIKNDIDNTKILNDTIGKVKNLFSETNLSIWAQKSYLNFINDNSLIKAQHFANNNKNLFENVLQNKYIVLYHHRNRCAHNTSSYQQNLPTLKTLSNIDYKYENYFIWFSLLVLIDEIFIEMYKIYLKGLNEKI